MFSSPLHSLRKNPLYPSDLAVFQPHLDSVRVVGGICQNVFNDTGGSLTGPLILFQYNFYP